MSSPVVGPVRAWLRLEGLAYLVLSVALYRHFGGGWGRFAALFLIPDLSFAGYLFGSRAGAWAYNSVHSAVGPLLLGALAVLAPVPVLAPLACIWLGHVGLDRALGYGLKYESAFGDTHLGHVGRARVATPALAG